MQIWGEKWVRAARQIASRRWNQLCRQINFEFSANTIWGRGKWASYGKDINNLGKPVYTKMDEFLENFRTAFDPSPPPHFRKIILRIFYKAIQPQKPYMWYIFEKPWVREYQK